MRLRISYKQDRDGQAPARWSVEVYATDFIATLKELMDDAERTQRTITQVSIEGHEHQYAA